ncbi:MAG: Stk1 family PASTA domain-containing Ser/Thr kinase [Nocardioidaceae bacterium]
MAQVAENTLVDGRYRVLRRIGSGGMADVYCAADSHLGREVALKVLHQRFATDESFVERFRREASSAAALQHPNVVAVFDRGRHEGTYYIAMERLRGRTLKQILAEEGPLAELRAIELALQILAAAGFAHRRGVIHRDLKPHNVVVDEQGTAKVADFGIARAGASQMTETGSMMGTAQYLSPEQAQGQPVTPASDLYSIGVILYEMLAGRPPFDGDGAVSVALKHVSEEPPPLSLVRPGTHPALEAVVMTALAKEPARRWGSAEDFAAALEAARAQIVAAGNGGQETAERAALPGLLPGGEPPAGEPPREGDAAAAPPPGDPPPEAAPAGRRRRWPRFTLTLIAFGLAALLALLGAAALQRANRVEVPRVVGAQLLRATTVLERAGFRVKQSRVRSEAALDTVLGQDPGPGERAAKGSTVTLEISNGPGNVRVPSVEQLPAARAVRQLNRAGLKVTLDQESSTTVAAGVAIRTVPREGTEVERDTRVRLFVSSGPPRVAVPDLVGLSRSSAEGRLGAAGLGAAVEEQESSAPEGEVLAQSPAAGAVVTEGTRVTITVARAEAKLDVPNVVGLSAGEAAGALQGAGLSVVRTERRVSSADEDGKVLAQRPGGGTQLARGGAVAIVVGRYEPPRTETERTEPQSPSTTVTSPTPAPGAQGGSAAPEGR